MRRPFSLSLSVFCIILVARLCSGVVFTDCGSKIGKFSRVSVSNCDESKPTCDLVRQTNVTITIEFMPNTDCTMVKAVVYGVLMDLPIPFPLNEPNACADPNSGVTCPLTHDTSYTYTTTLPIRKTYPKVSVTVKWQLQNENNEDIVCVLIPAKIK